jgi:hypothetical protein
MKAKDIHLAGDLTQISSVPHAHKYLDRNCEKCFKCLVILINLFIFQIRFSNGFMDEAIASTNNYFGGLNPHVYRVFFTHGEMDPRR